MQAPFPMATSMHTPQQSKPLVLPWAAAHDPPLVWTMTLSLPECTSDGSSPALLSMQIQLAPTCTIFPEASQHHLSMVTLLSRQYFLLHALQSSRQDSAIVKTGIATVGCTACNHADRSPVYDTRRPGNSMVKHGICPPGS